MLIVPLLEATVRAANRCPDSIAALRSRDHAASYLKAMLDLAPWEEDDPLADIEEPDLETMLQPVKRCGWPDRATPEAGVLILQALAEHGPSTSAQLSRYTRLAASTIRKTLHSLASMHQVHNRCLRGGYAGIYALPHQEIPEESIPGIQERALQVENARKAFKEGKSKSWIARNYHMSFYRIDQVLAELELEQAA